MSKTLHAGKGSYAGVLSAYLARNGFTGATRILEGEKGFCRAVSINPHLEKLTAGLGKGFKIDDNSFKPYACCKHSHAGLYAVQVLRKENNLQPQDVAKIELFVNNITDFLINNPGPENPYGCKFSIQYCTACAIQYGTVGIEQFAPAAMHDAATRRLMERIEVRQDAAVQAVYDGDATKLAAKVVVRLQDGRLLEKEVDYPKGDPANPMTWEESVAKFMRLVKPVYGIEKAKKLADLVDTLDDVGDFALAIQGIIE